jgi:hypothetical protein
MSLAALVNDSTTLQRLVQLGVSLATWDQRGYARLAAKLDFAADVAPLVRLGRHFDTGLAAKLDFAADVAPLVRLGRHFDTGLAAKLDFAADVAPLVRLAKLDLATDGVPLLPIYAACQTRHFPWSYLALLTAYSA